MKCGQEVANGSLHLYQRQPSVPPPLPEAAGGPGSNSELFQAHQAAVLRQEWAEGVGWGGRKRSCIVYVGLHMMRQSEY
jgi:hypothetical protein